ncbi:hypothetical protein YQE_02308, partial [Dendroctonus ponderosae]
SQRSHEANVTTRSDDLANRKTPITKCKATANLRICDYLWENVMSKVAKQNLYQLTRAKSYSLDEWLEMDADSRQSQGVLEALHNNCTLPNTGYLIVSITPPRKGLHPYHLCNKHRTLEHIKSLNFRTPV